MIKELKESFNEHILSEAMDRYSIAGSEIKFLGGFESFVYEYKRGSGEYILKITHEIRRSENYIMGEIDWLNYLASRGLEVCKAVPSAKGRFVEKIPDGSSHFLAISYEKAKGHEVTEKDWNSELFENWGQLVGKMHAATKNYTPSHPDSKRQQWFEEEQLKARKYLSPSHRSTIESIENLVERLRKLPIDDNSYGLVHSDLHQKNFFIENQKLYAFDFDDIGYHYFIHDISNILYYALLYPYKQPDNGAEYARLFFKHFMKGYEKENVLDHYWFNVIPDFIRLRHAVQLVIFHQTSHIGTLNEQQLEMLETHHEEVRNGIPMISSDFWQKV